MTIAELKQVFKTELSKIYADSEISELFSIFCSHILDLDKFQQRIYNQKIVPEDKLDHFNKIISELRTGKPFQQILGETEFYGLKFFVSEHVLIPRPETEELLELAITEIKKMKPNVSKLKILDIGTGSGIIPVVLKKHFPHAEVYAIDYSGETLETAKKNAIFHELEINFIHQNYLEENLNEVYDIIISNPPYIGIDEEHEIAESVKHFEPNMALFSPTPNALIFYEKIAEDCKNNIAASGLVFLEINQKLGTETLELFTKVLHEVFLMKDISGNDRFVFGKK